MRIGCLQFAPQVGDVNNNLNRADSVLSRCDPEDLDLLVLPELAFTGYNFKSLRDISQYLEPSGSGVTSLWARTTALKYDCTVIAGYPEKVDITDRWPASPEYYNSAIVVNSDGETIANYQKSHLYYTDETWALEGPSGFYAGRIPGLGRCAMGICMDINPYKFENPWDKFEFAHHCLDYGAHIIILPMAWLTHEDRGEYSRMPQEPDMQTMMYWVSRLEPIVRLESDREIIVIFANRTGVEDEVTYAGSSTVIGIKDGEVLVYGVLGRGDKELLVVDTDAPPFARLVHTNRSPAVPSNAQEPQEPDESGSFSDGSSIRSEPNQSDEEARNPSAEPSAGQGQTKFPTHERQASRPAINPNSEDLADLNSEAFDQDPLDLKSQSQSSVEKMDLLGRYLDEHQSRASSSNGYLNGQNSYVYDRRSSVGRTPDSLRVRRGSGSDLEPQPQASALSSRKPTWGQLPPRKDQGREDKWNVSDDDGIDGGISDGEWNSDADDLPWGRENRHSFRSDVSVWNNFSGQSKPAGAPSTPRSKMVTQKVEDYLRGSTPRSESQQDLRRFTEPTPAKVPDARSRQQTSSRTREYVSEASTPGRKHSSLNHQIQNVDDGHRSGSARATGYGSSVNGASKSTPQRRDSRTRANVAPPTSAKANTTKAIRNGAPTRAASIPIAMERDVPRESSQARRPPSAPVEDELPILRPASRSRLREHSESRGRAVGAPLKKVTSWNSDRVMASASGQKEARQLSRGRQRGTRSALDQHQPARHGPPRISHSAQNNRQASVEPVDLSQFHLIEEFPSASCPVHGSRSRSAARHGTRTGSRRRPSTDDHRRPGSRDVRESRRTTQNTPAQQTGGVSAPVSTPSKVMSSAPRRKPSKDLKASRRMTQSVQVGIAEPRRNGNSTFGNDIVTTEVTMGVTRLDLKHGPKTPVAMVLVGDNEPRKPKLDVAETHEASSFGIKGSNMHPSRPRSAVW